MIFHSLRQLYLFAVFLSIGLPLSRADVHLNNNNLPISSAEIGDASPFHPVKFDNGINFGDPENKFSLGMRFRMQNRAEFTDNEKEGFRHDWMVRRARLRFNGHVADPRLRYLIQLSFTPSDQNWSESKQPNVLRDAMALYQVTDNWQIAFGQGKLPGNRQRVVSSGDQQFVDRSIVNANFNLDRDFGFQSSYKLKAKEQVFLLRGAITSGEGRNRSVPSDGRFFYSGRLEWLPFGEFDRQGDYFESDLAREKDGRLSVGYSLASLVGSARTNGAVGKIILVNNELVRRSQLVQFLDLIYKKQGFSLYIEYARRDLKDPYIDSDFSYLVGSGLNTQMGYMLSEKNELAVRYSQIIVNGSSRRAYSDIRQWTMAYNYFLSGHRVKLQTELGYTEDVDKFVRLQLELGI